MEPHEEREKYERAQNDCREKRHGPSASKEMERVADNSTYSALVHLTAHRRPGVEDESQLGRCSLADELCVRAPQGCELPAESFELDLDLQELLRSQRAASETQLGDPDSPLQRFDPLRGAVDRLLAVFGADTLTGNGAQLGEAEEGIVHLSDRNSKGELRTTFVPASPNRRR